MISTFVKLKLTLLANTFRRSTWQTVGAILGVLTAVSIVVFVALGATIGGTLDPLLTGQIVTVVGALTVLGWWLLPLLIFGIDATLDPRQFNTYPISRGKLMAGLAIAAIFTIPGLGTALSLLSATISWLPQPGAAGLAALLGAVLALALCILGSRATTALLAPVLESRRTREVFTILVFIPIMLLSPAITWLSARVESGIDAAETADQGLAFWQRAVDIVGWTPFGAPFALATDVWQGRWLEALARLLIIAATCAMLWAGWAWALRRSLEQPAQAAQSRRKQTADDAGLFDRFPATPTGAVLARTATYWRRDPRYSVSLIVIALLPLTLLFAAQGEGALVALGLAPLTAWILGFTIANDVAFDNTAFALHVSSGVSGRADRWGRLLPVLFFGIPVVLLFAVLSVGVLVRVGLPASLLSDDPTHLAPAWFSSIANWSLLPPVLGISLGMLLAGLGISSATSARWLYPVAKPGESPLRQPQGSVMASMAAQGVNSLLTFLAAIPALVLGVLAVVRSSPMLGWVTLVVGPLIGALVLVAGVRWGARAVDQHGPDLLQKLMSYA